MASSLKGKKIAILATDGFEQSELMQPRQALEEAGAHTEVISPNSGKIKGWDHKDWGESVKVDKDPRQRQRRGIRRPLASRRRY
jgi:protease I